MKNNFVSQSLQDLIWEAIKEINPSKEKYPVLFHYTPLENKNKIIMKEKIDLRFTRADRFRDTKEVLHSVELMKKALSSLFNQNKIDKAYFQVMKEYLDIGQDVKEIVRELRSKYVFCFSKNGNSEYLKNNYACANNSKGVKISFDVFQLGEFLHDDEIEGDKDNFPYPEMFEVEYNDEEVIAYMQAFLLKMYQLRDQDDEKRSLSKIIIREVISVLGLVYKDGKQFHQEEETRIILDETILNYTEHSNFYSVYMEKIECMGKEETYIHVLMNPIVLQECEEVTP